MSTILTILLPFVASYFASGYCHTWSFGGKRWFIVWWNVLYKNVARSQDVRSATLCIVCLM